MSVKDDGLMAMRYAGALGLLAECAVQVDDETVALKVRAADLRELLAALSTLPEGEGG